MLYQIPLTNSNLVATVDEVDYEKCIRKTWYLDHGGYARMVSEGNSLTRQLKTIRLRMHQFIMGEIPVGYDVIDHINGNKLNNTRENLRFVTNSENVINSNNRIRKKVDKREGLNY